MCVCVCVCLSATKNLKTLAKEPFRQKDGLKTLGAHAQRGLQYLVCVSVCLCLSVCLSVTTFSAATRNETAKKRYQRVQCHTGFIFKMAILIKMLRSKVMA